MEYKTSQERFIFVCKLFLQLMEYLCQSSTPSMRRVSAELDSNTALNTNSRFESDTYIVQKYVL